jgi:hypothetical protein
VPTQIAPLGGGAEAEEVIVMVVVALSAPAGICTEVPSEQVTVPPAGPMD